MASNFTVAANLVDIEGRNVTPSEVHVADGKITAIEACSDQAADHFLLPGFVDAHVHIESSMLVPSEFARAAVIHGTVATVSDPHEIGNVLKFYFGAPSCVPATTFETAGAQITAAEVETLLDDPRILYLSEMMNFPGILHGDPDCLAKVQAAHDRGKPVDGHAPGLRGEQAAQYIKAGITTDHECFTKEEALDKLAAGCKISIREGSAARNFDALYELLGEHVGMTMLCSDDKHPDELLLGHINSLIRRAIARGIDLYDALRAACVTPVKHYGLEVGQLRVGDPADFIEVDSLTELNVLRTWIDGDLVAENGESRIDPVDVQTVNNFTPSTISAEMLRPDQIRTDPSVGQLQVIEAIDGQLVTNRLAVEPTISAGFVTSNPSYDILKLAVVNRYQPAKPAVAFIKSFGLRQGAIASSVAHDSHNVIGVGVEDADLAAAINLVMESRGGLSAVDMSAGVAEVLALPVAGLMATESCATVAAAYSKLDRLAKTWGSTLRAPYMTLSFMALLVIPELKLSDLGLFDGGRFEFTSLLA